jgi:hypothetical protein
MITTTFDRMISETNGQLDQQFSAAVELITPDLARQYLGQNTHNRNIRQGKVLAYAEDMKAGRWEMNGASIAFGLDGVLDDGQHRLLAVIESDIPVRMLVVRGLSAAAQDTIDTGLSRKLADVLTLRGEKNASTMGAALRSVFIWQSGRRTFGGASGAYTTIPQLLRCLEDNAWVRDYAPLMKRLATTVKLPASVSGALIYAFNDADPVDAVYFWDRLMSDEGHTKGEPIFTLRKALLSSKDHRGTRNVNYLAAITIKAWNRYRAGETCEVLIYRTGGAQAEKFPEVR